MKTWKEKYKDKLEAIEEKHNEQYKNLWNKYNKK